MKALAPEIEQPFKIRGIEICPGDAPEVYVQKLARIAFNELLQPVALLTIGGIVLESNPAALAAAGIAPAEAIGRPLWETAWWDAAPKNQFALREAIAQAAAGQFVHREFQAPHPNCGSGNTLVDFTLLPVRDQNGRPVYLLAEWREKRCERPEQGSNREKARFFADISHEFGTPLTLLLGPVEDALADAAEPLGARQRERMQLIERNGLRLQKLVNTLLDFLSVDAGGAQPVLQPTSLGSLTRDLAGSFQLACDKAGLRLTVDAPDLNQPVFVDRQMWEKIVLHLLSNAFKFTFEGEIGVSLTTERENAVLRVLDTGTGIPEAELPFVFDRFRRVQGPPGRTREGAGIGLALVRELVRLHHGSVEAHSLLDHGSTFVVRIPFGTAHVPPTQSARPAELSTATRARAFVSEALCWLPGDSPVQAAPRAPRARILVAGGNSDMRDYLRRLLSEEYDVELAADAEAALTAARRNLPDLILSDVITPQTDGACLLRALSADPQLRFIPVTLLSARAGGESRTPDSAAATAEYLLKPFSARELLDRVESQIGLPRTRADGNAWRESEHRFRIFADNSPAILWLSEADGSASFFSSAWRDFTGQAKQDALGFGWLESVHADDREATRQGVLEAHRTREPFSLDCRLRRDDGQYRYVAIAGRPRLGPDDAFTGFTGSVIDIHERQLAAQSTALLSAIVDSCDDAIVSKDLNGIIKSWNKAAERLFGYTADEAIGQSITMIIPTERLDEEPKILEKLRRGERIDHFETIRVRKDGTQFHISLTISPVKDAKGRIVGASKVARDITDRVRQERDLQAANAALQRANADLQQFAYSASHDLQEPLRMVATYSELIRRKFGGKLGQAGDEYIGHTVQGAVRMENLLKDLRTYIQVFNHEHSTPGEVDAGEVLQRTLFNLEVAIRDSGATVTSTALPRVPILEFQLEQLFQNLIGNAIRYRSTLPPRIHVAAVRQEGEWLLSVEDNGIGIEPQFKEHIFGIFKRLHSAADYPGTGMGLAICQRIVERAGGRIWVESEPGKGSTFFFTLPCRHRPEGPGYEDRSDPLDRGQHGGCGIGP